MQVSTRLAYACSYLGPLCWGLAAALAALAFLPIPGADLAASLAWQALPWVLLTAFLANAVVSAHAFMSAEFPRDQRRGFYRRLMLGSSPYQFWRKHVSASRRPVHRDE